MYSKSEEYKGYSQQYDTGYVDENQIYNQFNYDYSNDATDMMMNQQRISRNQSQYRNQNYISYPQMNSLPINNALNNFNQGAMMYSQTRSLLHNSNLNPSNIYIQPQYTNSQIMSQMSAHNYSQPQLNGQYVSFQTHQLLIKQFKLTLTMLKSQNNALIQKSKLQARKLADQFRLIKQFVMRGDLNQSTAQTLMNIVQENQYHFMNDIENTQSNLSIVHSSNNGSNFTNMLEAASTSSNNFNQNPNKDQNQVVFLLQRKIRSIGQKKSNQHKAKIQNIQKPVIYENSVRQNPNQQTINPSLSVSQSQRKKAKKIEPLGQQRIQTQDQLQNQPMYPQDFSGQQSFLVDQQVEKKQKLKKLNKNHPKANTFGMKTLQRNELEFKKWQCQKRPQLLNQYQIVEEFFDNYFSQIIEQAPQKQSFGYKIGKLQIYLIYNKWRQQNKGSKNLFDEKIIQKKINSQFKKRFLNANQSGSNFSGIKFKDSYKNILVRH